MKTSRFMNSFFTTSLAAFCAMSATLTGCMEDTPKNSGTTEGKTDGVAVLEQVVIDNIAQNVIVATYRDLNTKTHEMAQLAKILLANPTEANLNALQLKWRETRIPWESSESFVFGPGSDTDPTIDSWPLSVKDLNHILATRADFDLPFIRSLGNDLKGFHTAEFLMFGDGEVKNTKSIQEMTEPQMKYLVSVTAVIAEQTQTLFTRWTQKFDPSDVNSKAFVDIVRKPGLESQLYPSRKAVLEQYVKAMSKIANEVGAIKIQTPLGGNIGAADGSQVESQFSWNSLADFTNNIHSLRNIYTGDYAGLSGAGLDELVKLKNPALNDKILAQLDECETAIQAIAGPEKLSYTLAIKNEPARARARIAIEALANLGLTIDSELLKVL